MPRLILISGWANPGESLDLLSEGLSARFSVNVLSVHELPDFAGIKNPDFSATVTAPSVYAAGLSGVIKKKDGPCILIGWSAGGLVALETAVRFPDMVNGLVLLSTTARFCSDAGYPYGSPLSSVRAMAQGLQKDTKKTLTGFFKDVSSPVSEDNNLLEAKVKAGISIGVDSLLDSLQYLRMTDLRSALSSIDMPVLILHGEKDAVIPWQAGRYLAEGIRNSTWVLHENAGHDLPVRYPQFVLEQIREFLNSRPACSPRGEAGR